MSPREQYSTLLADRNARVARLDALNVRIERVRLGIGAAFLIIAWLCIGPARISALWLALPVLGFISLLLFHQRVRNRRTQARRAADFYQAGLDRLNDQWSGKGTSGARFDVQHHIYGDDLDLFGTDSLYELLCAARTQLGENILAQWLLAPADLSAIRCRHASVVDLRARLQFRESMAVDGESLKIELHPETLDAWARAPNRLESGWIRWTAPLLAGIAIGAIAIWAVWDLLFPLLAVILAEAAIGYFLRKPIHQAITTVEGAFDDLKGLSVLLKLIEAQRFGANSSTKVASRLRRSCRWGSVDPAVSKVNRPGEKSTSRRLGNPRLHREVPSGPPCHYGRYPQLISPCAYYDSIVWRPASRSWRAAEFTGRRGSSDMPINSLT